MNGLQINITKSKSMLLELVKKGFEFLKSALEKFKVQREEIDYIIDQSDHIFSLYMENGLYDKIDNICEDDFFDSIVDYSLNSAEYDIDEFIISLLDNKGVVLEEDKKVIVTFFHKIRDIIVDAQVKYGIKDSENKVLSKQIQAVQKSLDNITTKNEADLKTTCFIGILACEVNDPRTRELLEFPEDNLLNLNAYVSDFSDAQKIINQIECFKNQLNNTTIYKVKLACNYSIAYLCGAILSQKISNLVFINRNNEWEIGEADKIRLSCKTINISESGNINVAVSIGTINYIDDDVRAFVGEGQGLISIHYANHIQTSGQFNALSNEITKKLKKLSRDFGGPIHLFYRGPVEIMFLLGQKSNDFGQCTIYEYPFKERDIQKRKYIKGITY